MLDKNSPLLRNEFWKSAAEREEYNPEVGLYDLPHDQSIRLATLEAQEVISVLNEDEKAELKQLRAKQKQIAQKNQNITLEAQEAQGTSYTDEEMQAAIEEARNKMDQLGAGGDIQHVSV